MKKSDRKLMAFAATLFIFVLAGGGLWTFILLYDKSTIESFEECKNAGYPILESYPEQCRAHGQTFVNPDQVR
jgi:hypothetical protein